MFSETNLKENFCEIDFNPLVHEDFTENMIGKYCPKNESNKKQRRNSQDFFSFYHGYDISYYDMNNHSYFNEYEIEEEKNFKNCFDNFFKLSKNNLSAIEDHEDLNSLLFISIGNEHLNSSTENSLQDKLDFSVQVDSNSNKLLNKKRKIFQINYGISSSKTMLKQSKKVKFVTFNVYFRLIKFPVKN